MALLEINDLKLSFQFPTGELPALDDFSLVLEKGERVGIVGESGAGKSLAVFSILGLLKPPCVIKSGSIRYQGRELIGLKERELRTLRGGEIAMIFQNPLSSLNPLFTVGAHLIETARAHRNLTYQEAYELACDRLNDVKISRVKERMNAYPHEFSGGMRQRIVIACALMTEPKLIIADEPTTALDVTIQAEIMELLYNLSDEKGCSLILVSHDLGLISQVTERVLVLYAGKIIEAERTQQLIHKPRHPYTEGLLACLPELHDRSEQLKVIAGRMPGLGEWPTGCRFHPRCAYAQEQCHNDIPLPIAPTGQSLKQSNENPNPSEIPEAYVKCFFPLQ